MSQYTLNSLISENSVEKNNNLVDEMQELVLNTEKKIKKINFNRMFHHEHDSFNAYLDIQSGSGGTEAQDWVAMLLRMYLRWSESHKY